jgi:hypothetical protein
MEPWRGTLPMCRSWIRDSGRDSTPRINFMFIVNETKVQYKNSIFMTMVRIFCPKEGVMSCIFQITCRGSDS